METIGRSLSDSICFFRYGLLVGWFWVYLAVYASAVGDVAATRVEFKGF